MVPEGRSPGGVGDVTEEMLSREMRKAREQALSWH